MGSSARYKGVIFDWDGTLANTVELNCQVWRKIMLNHGVDIPSERFKPYIGKGGRLIILDFLGKDTDEMIIGSMLTEKSDAYIEVAGARGENLLNSGALELLEFLRANGIRTAIGTAGTKNAVETLLETTGIGHTIDAISTVEDAGISTRPKPIIFSVAAKRLGVGHSEAAIVGDADADMEGGKIGNFGLNIQVLGPDRLQERSKSADVFVTDLAEIGKLIV